MAEQQILISAGEASGEMYASRLASALRQRASVHLFGLGGPQMREAGVELLAESSEIAVVGISEVVRRLPSVLRIHRKLNEQATLRKPRLAILVDSPGFNLRLARLLRRQGVRSVYFIGPQVWAWRPGRVRWIRRRVERMLCIFPFEEKFYREAGVPVTFVGHPLVSHVRPRMSREEFAAQHGLDATRPLVALLPGSRPSELKHNLPPILEACGLIQKEAGPPQFALALASGLKASDVAECTRAGVLIRIIEGATYDTLAAADVAIVSSGTATVEAALLGTPMVVVYRVSATTAFFLRRLVRTPFFSMVNLIAGRRVVPELIQDEFTPERVSAEARRLLDSREAREHMKRDLGEVRSQLGPEGAIERAAEIIARML